MKQKRNGIYLFSVLLFLSVGFGSCTDWLNVEPNDKQTEEQQFAVKDGFYAAINGVYNRMSGNSLYGGNLSYGMVDILGQHYMVEQNDQGSYYEYLRALTEWNYTNESVLAALSSTWGEAYQTIMNINVIINNLETDRTEKHVLPEAEYKMLKGEMLAARAMIHLDLLRLFGPIYSKNPTGKGVPYNESMETSILEILSAESVLEDYIIRDLKEGQTLLLETDPVLTEGPKAEYDSENMDNSMRYRQLRLNYYATVLLTARAYLWKGDYANALSEAQKLTDDTKVREFFPKIDPNSLLGNASDPDRMFSTECLFGYYDKNRGLIYDDYFSGGSAGKKLLIPRSGYVDGQLFSGYDTEDWRKQSQWVNGTTLDGNATMQLVKFESINDAAHNNASSGEDGEETLLMEQKFYGTFCSLIKLSEAYYIAAECCGTSGSEVYDLATAWSYLNAMRNARGLGSYDGATAETYLQQFLTLEYCREFVGEGQKFFYFKRRNQGFDNQYNGRKEIAEYTPPPLPFLPGIYDYTDKATDAEKEKRFVLPLPQSEMEFR